jgi:hypothetical protein
MLTSALLALAMETCIQADVDVWAQNMRMSELANAISTSAVRYTCDPAVADRRVHVFVRQEPPATIAERVSKTMGLEVAKVDGGWRFSPNETYERMIRGHSAEVRRETTKALRRLIDYLKRHPPRRLERKHKEDSAWTASIPRGDLPKSPQDQALYFALETDRADVLWTLANSTKESANDLLAGHAVVGAVPAEPGFIPIPGVPDDYRYFRGSQKGYVVLKFDADSGRIRITPVNVPSLAYPPGAYVSDFQTLIVGGGLFAYGAGWTTLGKWSKSWADDSTTIGRPTGSVPWKPNGPGHGPAAEALARRTGRPTIVEASPLRPDQVLNTFETYELGRNEYGWTLAKPPGFWALREAWQFERALDRIPKPVVDEPIRFLDWSSQITIRITPFMRQYMSGSDWVALVLNGGGRIPEFARFWTTLSYSEKETALNSELKLANLRGNKAKTFVDAVSKTIGQGQVQGDTSSLFRLSAESRFRVRWARRWALLEKYGATIHSTERDMQMALMSGARGTPNRGFEFELEFKSTDASAKSDFLSVIPIHR